MHEVLGVVMMRLVAVACGSELLKFFCFVYVRFFSTSAINGGVRKLPQTELLSGEGRTAKQRTRRLCQPMSLRLLILKSKGWNIWRYH